MPGVRRCPICRAGKQKCVPAVRIWIPEGQQDKCERCAQFNLPCGPPEFPPARRRQRSQALEPQVRPNARYWQPLDSHFMQGNQRVPVLPNSFDVAGLDFTMWACMVPEAQGRFATLPLEKQNELVIKWLGQRERKVFANNTQATTLQMHDQEYYLNINSDVFATAIEEPGFGRLEGDLEEQEGVDVYPEPFTDSGYKSAPNLENYPNVQSSREKTPHSINIDSSLPAGDGDNDDAKTSYSIGTTVNPGNASSYIVETMQGYL